MKWGDSFALNFESSSVLDTLPWTPLLEWKQDFGSFTDSFWLSVSFAKEKGAVTLGCEDALVLWQNCRFPGAVLQRLVLGLSSMALDLN